MKVFLLTYSYHKGKWGGRAVWPIRRMFAESEKEARERLVEERGGTTANRQKHPLKRLNMLSK